MLFTSIIGLLTGLAGPLAQAFAASKDLQAQRVKAETQQEKDQLDAQIAAIHDRQIMLTAEAGSRLNSIVRAVAASGPILYVQKIFLWDKVVGAFFNYTPDWLFSTDKVTTEQWALVIAVYACYFLYDFGRKK